MLTRLANRPIALPKGISVNVNPNNGYAEVKGKKTLSFPLPNYVKLDSSNDAVKIEIDPNVFNKDAKMTKSKAQKKVKAQIGTIYANLKNAIAGVSEGFKVKLELVGVGYRCSLTQPNKLNLSLGYSHPVVFELPKDVSAEIPSQTEIVFSSHDKQLLGLVAARVRRYRPPECYKGKGIKFAGEVIILKETKKK